MTKDECLSRLTMAQKNKKELKKIKLQLLKEIQQLKLMHGKSGTSQWVLIR